MLLKVVGLLVMIAIILGLIYVLGSAVYDHWFNKTREDARELEYQADRLEKLIQKVENK